MRRRSSTPATVRMAVRCPSIPTPTPRAAPSMSPTTPRASRPSSKPIPTETRRTSKPATCRGRTRSSFLLEHGGGRQRHPLRGRRHLHLPQPAGDLTLYAQWGVTTGLTGGGATTHYAFYYDESLGGTGGVAARTNAVIADCETDFGWMQTQSRGVDISKAMTLPIPTYVTVLGGGAGWGPPLTLKPGKSGPASLMRCLMVAEVSEMLMDAQHKGWGFTVVRGQRGKRRRGPVTVHAPAVPSSSPRPVHRSPHRLHRQPPPPNSAEFPFTAIHTHTHFPSLHTHCRHTLTTPSLTAITAVQPHRRRHPGLDSSGNTIGGACLRGVYLTTGYMSLRFADLRRVAGRGLPAGPGRVDPRAEPGRPLAARLAELRGRQEHLEPRRDHRHHRHGRNLHRWRVPGARRLQPERPRRRPAVPPRHRVRRSHDRAVGHAARHCLPEHQSQGPPADRVRLRPRIYRAARHLPGERRRRRRSARPSACSARPSRPRRSSSSSPGPIPTSTNVNSPGGPRMSAFPG